MKNIIIFLMLVVFSNLANAGFNGLTHHSRANCVNNESISWDWTQNWETWVTSMHYPDGVRHHDLVSKWQLTWRNAMVHWGEGKGGWIVVGYHYMKNKRGDKVLVASEQVSDCSIYDGWWDRNK